MFLLLFSLFLYEEEPEPVKKKYLEPEPVKSGSRTKGGSTAVEAFQRVICNSQIHTETNRATQQVSHSFSV